MKQPVAQQVHVDAPWKIPPRAWWEILKRVYGALSANHVGLLAAGVAYYAFLSIAPMMAAVVLTYGLFGDPAMVGRHMQAIIAVVPADAAKLINDQLLASSAPPNRRSALAWPPHWALRSMARRARHRPSSARRCRRSAQLSAPPPRRGWRGERF